MTGSRVEQDRGQVMDGWPMMVTTTIIVAVVVGYVGVQFAVGTFRMAQPPGWLTAISVGGFVVLVLVLLSLPLYGHYVGGEE